MLYSGQSGGRSTVHSPGDGAAPPPAPGHGETAVQEGDSAEPAH